MNDMMNSAQMAPQIVFLTIGVMLLRQTRTEMGISGHNIQPAIQSKRTLGSFGMVNKLPAASAPTKEG